MTHTRPQAPGYAASARSTSDAILLTALHLFATEGIDKVTLRRISAESGSSNTAAVHYHFKDKLGLVTAIIDFLERELWAPSLVELQAAIDANAPLREVLEVGCKPAKAAVFNFPWGGDAQSFMFQVLTGNNETSRERLREMAAPFARTWEEGLRKSVPELSREEFEQRWQFLSTEASVGQWARKALLREEVDKPWSIELERAYLKRYIDYVCGGLTAPVS